MTLHRHLSVPGYLIQVTEHSELIGRLKEVEWSERALQEGRLSHMPPVQVPAALTCSQLRERRTISIRRYLRDLALLRCP